MLQHLGIVPLESERLMLRGLTVEDAGAAFHNWTSDAEVARYMPWRSHETPAETEAWIRQCVARRTDPAYYDWGIFLKETGAPIGTIGANFEDDGGEPGEVGYAVGRGFWRQGYASEALGCVVRFLTKEVGATRLIGKQCVENEASGAVMIHAGFRHTHMGSYQRFDGSETFLSKVFTYTQI